MNLNKKIATKDKMFDLPESTVKNDTKKILSPEGFVNFLGVNRISKDRYIHLKFSNGKELKCSEDHPISTIDGIKRVKDINKNIEILTEDGIGCFIISKQTIKKQIYLYDIINSGNYHLYYSNGIISHNCEFIGSSNTLISGSKLKLLTFRNPILSEDDFDIYEHPKKNNLYICVVDCSEGVGLDYSTVSVIDVTQIPYVQVAKYRNNTIPTLLFPATIFSIAMRYNEAFVLVESNNMGQQIVDALHYDLEYDNVFKVENHNIKGPTISSGFKRSVTIGLKNTKSVKKIGCANLKALIEDDKLILNDFDTISELYTFIRVKDSYAADEGQHDDLVMGLVIFGWLTTQSYFKESTNIDIRKLMTEEHDMLIEENLSAFGIIDNGLDEVLISDGHDLWSLADLPHNYHT